MSGAFWIALLLSMYATCAGAAGCIRWPRRRDPRLYWISVVTALVGVVSLNLLIARLP